MGARDADSDGRWENWRWDPTLFGGAAPHYVRGRLPYAPGLADAMAGALLLEGTGTLLDLGCGPGTVTIPLAPFYESAIGVDPDALMIKQARAQAALAGAANTRWILSRAEELRLPARSVRTITVAASFHWMDRPLVARMALSMLSDDGMLVHIDNRHQDGITPAPGLPAPPLEAIDQLRDRYLGPRRRAGQSIRETSPGDEDDVLRAAGFAGPQRVIVPDGRVITRTVDDLVAERLSMSASAPHLFGDRLDAFEAELRELLTAAGGSFAITAPDNELKIWRAA